MSVNWELSTHKYLTQFLMKGYKDDDDEVVVVVVVMQ